MSVTRKRYSGIFFLFILPILFLMVGGPVVSLWLLRDLQTQTLSFRTETKNGMDALMEIAEVNREVILADQRVTELLERALSGSVSMAQLYRDHTELVDLYAVIAERIDNLSQNEILRDSFSDPIADMDAAFDSYRGAMIQATDIVTIDPDLASEYRQVARDAFGDFISARYELSVLVTGYVTGQTDRELELLVDASDRLLLVSTVGLGLVFVSSLGIGMRLSRSIDLFADYLSDLVEGGSHGEIPELPREVVHLNRSRVREFRSLSLAVGAFRDTLEDSFFEHRALEQYQDNLERMVADRTEDLELYRLMVEKTGIPAYLNDMEDGFRMTYVNEAAVRHFGYTREEILSWRAPDWNPNFTDEDLRVIREEKKIRPGMVFESTHRVKGGDLVPVEVTINPITYRGRDCSFGFFVDIRERKQNEAALRDAKDRAEEAARIKSVFLANMSHEIRTPMNAVINLSRLALRTDLTEQQRDYLTKILRSGEGLLGVINDVLDFSKIEAGRLELDLIPFDTEKLIREIVDVTMFGAEQEKEIEFVADVPEELPRVVGDPLRLRQVLINLLGNALKFTEQGEVVLEVRILESGSDNITLDFSVRDTGIGMNEEQQARLFQAFEQADHSVSRKYGGSGLGLAISNSLLELMGSAMQVRSEPGAGSTFSFTLMLELAGNVESCTDETSPVDTDATGLRVLVVEDNEINRQIALELLTIAGVSGESVPGGAEALDVLRSERYDLVLMDLEMPGMDGYETTQRIRQDIDPALPIVAMTAHAISQVREQCLTAGMNDHISKPIDTDELQEILLRWIPVAGTGCEDPSDAGASSSSDETSPGSSMKSEAIALETLPGIDAQWGVRRVGNNRDLFLQLLEAFASDNVGTAEAVSAALAAGRREEARDIAHRIMGVAGNLGATTLYEVAGDLEEALRGPADGDPGDAEVIEGARQKFEAALVEVLGGLHRLFPG